MPSNPFGTIFESGQNSSNEELQNMNPAYRLNGRDYL